MDHRFLFAAAVLGVADTPPPAPPIPTQPGVIAFVGFLVGAIPTFVYLVRKMYQLYQKNRDGNATRRIQERKDIVDHQSEFIVTLQDEINKLRREVDKVRRDQQAAFEREAECQRRQARIEERLARYEDIIRSIRPDLLITHPLDSGSGIHPPIKGGTEGEDKS